MRTLILHHLEPEWQAGLLSMGTTIHEMIQKAVRHLRHARYDQVILTRFEWFGKPQHLEDEYYAELRPYITAVHTYDYGWEAEMFDDPSDYCEGGTHSQVVYIAPWMRELPQCNVRIAGAFDGECIEDLEIALRHLNIKFKRLEHLIV